MSNLYTNTDEERSWKLPRYLQYRYLYIIWRVGIAGGVGGTETQNLDSNVLQPGLMLACANILTWSMMSSDILDPIKLKTKVFNVYVYLV